MHHYEEKYDYTVRPMRLEDVDAVFSIEADSFSIPWSKEALMEEATGLNGAHMLVVEWEGRIVGYGGFRQVLDEADITNIAVAHDMRSRGVGKTIMKSLLELCRTLGIQYVMLEVRISNKPAIHIYERSGFAVAGIRRGYYEVPREDAVIMCKKLEN